MIVTLTLNPSVDRTVSVDGLTVGEVHRATSSRVDPGGKGINVTRALTANGTESIAVYPTGGPEGALMKRLLDAAGIARAAVSVVGSIRMNITIVDPHGVTTKVNEPGPRLSPAEVEAVRATTAEHLGRGGAQWLVISGSLPPGVDPAVYGDLVRLGHAAGARVAIDTSGATLAAAVAASPDVVKPNRDELAELLGTELPTLAAVDQVYGDEVAVVVVNVDRSPQEVEGARAFLAEQAPLEFYSDPTFELPFRLPGRGAMPQTVLIDRQGRIRAWLAGEADWNSPEVRALVDELVAEGG